jgi:hypothetical protein
MCMVPLKENRLDLKMPPFIYGETTAWKATQYIKANETFFVLFPL